RATWTKRTSTCCSPTPGPGSGLLRALQRLAGRHSAVAARPAGPLPAVLVGEPRRAQLLEGAQGAVVPHLAQARGRGAASDAARIAGHVDQALDAAIVALPTRRQVAGDGGVVGLLRLGDATRIVAARAR